MQVTDGRGGLPKVTLTHPSGGLCDIYLRGATIVSWVLGSGGEVFYMPENFAAPGVARGGSSFCFPQFGEGGEGPGSTPGGNWLPVDGIAKTSDWSLTQTGLLEDDHGEYPYVTVTLGDTEASRAKWNHNFHITLDISLRHDVIDIFVSLKNTGNMCFECAAAFRSFISVTDVEEPTVKYVGLNDCVYLDNMLHSKKPRVRFADECQDKEGVHLYGPTDRVYLNTSNLTGVEVGTGCTLLVRELCSKGAFGFSDRAIFNPWKQADADNYRWYAGFASGAIGKLIKLEPGCTHASILRFEVFDGVQSKANLAGTVSSENPALQKTSVRPKHDLLVEELPIDLQ
mgnify:FL=1